MEVHMSAMRRALAVALVMAPAGCATPVATLSGVVVGGQLATGVEVGRVSVIRSDRPEPTRLGMPLQKGDTVVTGPSVRALLIFQEEWEVALDAGTAVYVSNPKAWIKRGRIFVKKLVERVREAFEVEDEHRVFGAEGTEFMIESDGTGGVSITVLDGDVSVAPKNADWEPIVYGPLQRGHLEGDGPPRRMPSISVDEAEALRAFTLELEGLSNVTVPSVVGRLQQDAVLDLERAGLPVQPFTTRITGDVPEGTVLGQTPAAGARVRVGTEVALVVEGASARVPNVLGFEREAAIRTLRAAGLEVGSVRELETTERPAGTIVRVSPAAASLLEPGQRVDLTVAIEARVRVPTLTGTSLEAARARLAEMGLALGRVIERPTPRTRPGTVVDQSPAPGTRVAMRSAVELSIAVAPPFCIVPRLVGRTESQALALLAEAGLAAGDVQRLPYPPREEVTGQRIAAGRQVACGTRIPYTTGAIGRP
jgi:serine/threonine-protein kinase